ncbi:MAG TPA: hypothetical protein VK654_17360 [Nitrospirota bacterium]|nr:hypothetical protein [Nitrospirota bacterium]
MKSLYIVFWFVVLLAACSKMEEITSADRKYLFFTSDINQFHVDTYEHKLTPQRLPYIFFKSYTQELGLRAVYGTILTSPDGGEIRLLCMVNILPTAELASELFERMTPEPLPTAFGREEPVRPLSYHADDAYLYHDSKYFHIILISSRIVYSVAIDGAHIEETQVGAGLRKKIDYLRQNNVDAIH